MYPVRSVPTQPIPGQKPGTSGLRKKTAIFQGPNFLENYVQSIFDAIGGLRGKTLVIGGDGRFHNDVAIQTILRMAAANGAARCIVGQEGLLSTPAASHLIRKRGTDGGLILSASHNPGGPGGDFGLKYNGANGGPANEEMNGRIHARTEDLDAYRICDLPHVDLARTGAQQLGEMQVEIVDPVAEYAALMQSIFDFDAISQLLRGGFTLRFDAMHAVTGPYARRILEQTLGAAPGSVVNASPLPDFGGGHPDPNPTWAQDLMDRMFAKDAPDFGAASDGDGDRNMIVGKGIYVTPSDSLAVLAANAHLVPAYAGGLSGVARSMPTSGAVDRVAQALGIPVFATPTGWKFFGSLLDAGMVDLCGEESAGTGSSHVREKDGLWAVLMWLNILARRDLSVQQIMQDHWHRHGRNYYSRHDFEAIDSDAAQRLMADLKASLPSLPGQSAQGLRIEAAEDFCYRDPVDGSTAKGQGIILRFEGGSRAVFRLSGTGTEGATLRVYLERLETDPARLAEDPQRALAKVRDAAYALARIERHTGRNAPDVVT